MAASKPNEIRLIRTYDAPVSVVWDAWTVPDQVAKWWGPRGFSITTHEKDLRVGGTWRYTMHGPDGTDYPNLTTYFVVEPHRRLVYDHGASDDRPPLFRVDVTFAEANGKTTMDMTFSLATAEAAAQTLKFIKAAGGNSTWDRLAEYVEATTSGKPVFVINRSFNAPIERVFEAWTNPEQLVKWLPPAGMQMRFLRSGIAAGRSTHFAMTGDSGAMYARMEYLAVEPPRRIVYVQQFVDEQERPAAAPFGGPWPAALLTTVLLVEEGPGETRVTVTSEVHGSATPAEVDAFTAERSGMTRGWTGSFDVLEAALGAS